MVGVIFEICSSMNRDNLAKSWEKGLQVQRKEKLDGLHQVDLYGYAESEPRR